MSELHAVRQEGYQLLQRGCQELSIIEGNGIRIDTELLAATKVDLREKIETRKTKLKSSKVWRRWRKRFGQSSSLSNRNQLSTIFFDEMGHEPAERTATGQPKTDEESLQSIDHGFIRTWAKMAKYEKALGTFLKGIEREVVGDRLHPSFNLHTARSYRSSSDGPNFQNFPVRDKEISKIIRSLFIASPGHILVENDFQGIEVSMSASYHKDPNFISYITTPGKDMHRDMAAQLYCLEPEQVSKDARYGAKNKFVFPQFYGDFYISCTKALWEWMEKGELKGPDGEQLAIHLASHGIFDRGVCDSKQEPKPGTFEKHVKAVEDDFWNNRFEAYGQWRKDWHKKYLENGYFDLKTGFRVFGNLSRNAVVNYPVQGSAFHCLLWTLIRVNRKLRKYKMKSMLVGQIHDSLIGDIAVKELRDYFEIVESVVKDELPRQYKWINVPMVIEYELAGIGKSWHEKGEVGFSDGEFHHPTNPDKRTRDSEKFLRALEKQN